MFRFAATLSFVIFSTSVLASPFRQTTLVVQSLTEGDWKEAGQKTAEQLRQKLREAPSLTIVDPKNVDSVLKYYEGDSLSAEEPAVQEIKELLFQAKEHYFQLSYSEAEAELKRIVSIFQKNPGFIFNHGQDLVESWLTLGLVFAGRQEREKAVEAFRTVVRLAPFYSPEAKTFSPSLRRLFAEAKASLVEPQGKGHLRIEGEPKVAEVYLNGVYQGVSPLTLEGLPAGEYALSFKAHHYQTVDQYLSIEPQKTVTIRHKLYWQGPKRNVPKAKIASTRQKVAEGVRIAELLKVSKVLLVEVDEENISARLIDRTYRASHKPIMIVWRSNTERLEEYIEQLARLLLAQTELNLSRNPQAHLDPDGVEDPILIGHHKRKIPKGVWLGGLGAVGAGGVLAAILAGSGGSAGQPQTGAVSVRFK